MTVYILMAVGLLLVVTAVLLLVFRRLPLSWRLSFLLCGLILGAAGVGSVWYEREQAAEDYGNIYMALRYMEVGNIEYAQLYLQRTDLENDYHTTAAQALLDQVRGNRTMTEVRLGILENRSDLTRDQEDGLDAIRLCAGGNTGEIEEAVELLLEELPLDEDTLDELEDRFELETEGTEDDWEDALDNDEKKILRMKIDTAVGEENWEDALDYAVELVSMSPTWDDRLLLASVVAELTYFNWEMETDRFSAHDDALEDLEDTYEEEAEVYLDECKKLQRKLESVQKELETAEGDEAISLIEQEEKLTKEIDEQMKQANNIFALRALNSISDIHTLKAQVVRAKLYFAMRNYQQALDTLCQSAVSLQASFSPDRSLVRSLNAVKSAVEQGTITGTDEEAFAAVMQNVMGSAHPDLLSFSFTPVIQGMTEHFEEEEVFLNDDLYVVDLDDSQFPQITVRLGGKDEVLDRIAAGDMTSVSDTRNRIINYEAVQAHGMAAISSICFVVDVSGSMSGTPLSDAKYALHTFLDQTDGYTEMALVEFDSYANTVVALTTTPDSIRTGVDSLYAGGGTNITAGIREGTSALQNAQGDRVMIMMTDGQSSIDMTAVDEAVMNGIMIHTVGFGDVNDELLMQIAETSGGRYYWAQDSSGLLEIYESLRRVIGKSITVTYTVEDETAEDRYFFLQDGETGLAVREEYYVNEEVPTQTTPDTGVSFHVNYEPILIERSHLENYAQYGYISLYYYVYGENLGEVTSASIDGYSAEVYGSSSYIRIEVPTTAESGVYDLTLYNSAGRTLVVEDMIWIGEAVRYTNYTAGDLAFAADKALLMPDGSLALGSEIRITNTVSGTNRISTLSADFKGVITIPSVSIPEQVDGYTVRIRDNGTASALGSLTIRSQDKAYDYDASSTIYTGKMTLEFSNSGSRVVPVEVSE